MKNKTFLQRLGREKIYQFACRFVGDDKKYYGLDVYANEAIVEFVDKNNIVYTLTLNNTHAEKTNFGWDFIGSQHAFNTEWRMYMYDNFGEEYIEFLKQSPDITKIDLRKLNESLTQRKEDELYR